MGLGGVGVWQGGYGPPFDDDGRWPRGRSARLHRLLVRRGARRQGGVRPCGHPARRHVHDRRRHRHRQRVGPRPAHHLVGRPHRGRGVPRSVRRRPGGEPPPVVEARGESYDRPLDYMRRYLEAMAASVHSSPEPTIAPTVVLAALGPRMLELAAEAADGAHPYFVTTEHVRRARACSARASCSPPSSPSCSRRTSQARRLARLHTGLVLSHGAQLRPCPPVAGMDRCRLRRWRVRRPRRRHRGVGRRHRDRRARPAVLRCRRRPRLPPAGDRDPPAVRRSRHRRDSTCCVGWRRRSRSWAEIDSPPGRS